MVDREEAGTAGIEGVSGTMNPEREVSLMGTYESAEYPEEVKRSLCSSRNSGNYYFLQGTDRDRWGLNNAPYEPTFSVRSKKYYRITIRRRLLRELYVAEIQGLPVPVPRSQSIVDIEEFIGHFKDPVMLAIGNCAVDKDDMYKGLHRFNEVFVFDAAETEEDWRARHNVLEAAKVAIEWSGPEDSQGGLSWTYGTSREGTLAHQNIEQKRDAALFNHEIVFDESKNAILGEQCDNEALFYNNTKKGIEFVIYSYDHETVLRRLAPGQAILFSHPFPDDGEVD